MVGIFLTLTSNSCRPQPIYTENVGHQATASRYGIRHILGTIYSSHFIIFVIESNASFHFLGVQQSRVTNVAPTGVVCGPTGLIQPAAIQSKFSLLNRFVSCIYFSLISFWSGKIMKWITHGRYTLKFTALITGKALDWLRLDRRIRFSWTPEGSITRWLPTTSFKLYFCGCNLLFIKISFKNTNQNVYPQNVFQLVSMCFVLKK